MARYITVFIFIGLAAFYFFFPYAIEESSGIFVSIATFLFAIFTGFFISRQSTRLADIGTLISNFDGNMNSIMRDFGHFDKGLEGEVKDIIIQHYNTILETGQWDYHFTHKSNTLTNIHSLLDVVDQKDSLTQIERSAVTNTFQALRDQQKIRKNMVNLQAERIPLYQWLIIALLALILFLTISSVPSYLSVLGSILKAASVSSILFVVFLLHQLDTLKFFEKVMGQGMAQDVLDTAKGVK